MKKSLLKIILLALFLTHGINIAQAASEWDKTRLLGSSLINDVDTNSQANNEALDRLLTNYRRGAKIAYNSASTLDVQAGETVCSNSDGSVRKFRKNTSTTSATFSDIDTGSEAANTTYYVYAVCDADAETFTVKLSTNSATPSGVTYWKRLGYFTNNSSSDITAIVNDGDDVSSFGFGSGSINDGGTISLPSGFIQEDCVWFVAERTHTMTSDQHATTYANTAIYASSNRVVACDGTASADDSFTCNYMIVCSN